MFGLLSFPDFTQPLVTGLALANLTNLSVKILESLPFGVGRDFDSPLFRNERDLIVSVLVSRAVEDGTDALANRHIVYAPIRIEQNAIAILRRAIGKANEQYFAVATKHLVDLAFDCDSALEFQLRLFPFDNLSLLPLPDRRAESFFVIIDSVAFELFVTYRERRLAGCAQINWRIFFVIDDFGEHAADLESR